MTYFSYKKQAYFQALSTNLIILELDNREKILVNKYMTKVFSSTNWKDICNFLYGYKYRTSKVVS